MDKKYSSFGDKQRVTSLSKDEKKLMCVYIHCFFIIASIATDVYTYLDSQESGDKVKRDVITKASAFWVYYWLVEDLWEFDILKLSEKDTRRFLNEITYFFVNDFNFSHNELSKMLEDVHKTSKSIKSNAFLKLSEYFGENVKKSAINTARITLLAQTQFFPYHEILHEVIIWDEKKMEEVIIDFYRNYRKRKNNCR